MPLHIFCVRLLCPYISTYSRRFRVYRPVERSAFRNPRSHRRLFSALLYTSPPPPHQQTVPVGDGPARSYGRLRRIGGYAVSPSGNTKNRLSMRVRRPGGGDVDVEIEGAGGETRRVQRRSRRRADLRQLAGLQVCVSRVSSDPCTMAGSYPPWFALML